MHHMDADRRLLEVLEEWFYHNRKQGSVHDLPDIFVAGDYVACWSAAFQLMPESESAR